MKVLVMGGDGFCGWPTALFLSRFGHDVMIIDSFSRRAIDRELGTQSLTPIASLAARVAAWREITGNPIRYDVLDIAKNPADLWELLATEQFDTVVHFAEIRAAPYSMRSPTHKNATVTNNVCGTNNLLAGLAQLAPDTHLVHLGTMGVYGYDTGGMRLPEGYVDVQLDEPSGLSFYRNIVYPPNPGSVYHMTKVLDAQMFQFYAKNDGLRITDLHQGIVWGTNTDDTLRDPRLMNRFDYDGDYGTVLNRFIVQAAIGHPLTVHGTGGQTRAFIHIRDTVRCVRLAVENPIERGMRPRIMNQLTEVFNVRQLALIVQQQFGAELMYVDNPRKEAAENALAVEHDALPALGLQDPFLLSRALRHDVYDLAVQYRDRCNREKILSQPTWVSKIPVHGGDGYGFESA